MDDAATGFRCEPGERGFTAFCEVCWLGTVLRVDDGERGFGAWGTLLEANDAVTAPDLSVAALRGDPGDNGLMVCPAFRVAALGFDKSNPVAGTLRREGGDAAAARVDGGRALLLKTGLAAGFITA